MPEIGSYSSILYKIFEKDPQTEDLSKHAEDAQKFILNQALHLGSEEATYHTMNGYQGLTPVFWVTQKSALFSDWKIAGKGAYKLMYKAHRIAHDTKEGSDVACLFLENNQVNQQELAMLEHFKEHRISPEIIEKITFLNEASQHNTILIETLAPNGDLATFSEKENPPLSDDRIVFILYQVLHIVCVIHDAGYVHRDIKPANFLVFPGDIIKACDLGSLMKNEDQKIPYFGTLSYLSPESLKSTKEKNETSNLPSADIWAIGVLLVVISKFLRCKEDGQKRKLKEILEIISNLSNAPSSFQQRPPTRIQELILSYLQLDPDKRPTALKALQDPLLMQGLRESPSFLAAMNQHKISSNQIYKDLFGEDLQDTHAREVEKLYKQSEDLIKELPQSPVLGLRGVQSRKAESSPYTLHVWRGTPARSSSDSPGVRSPVTPLQPGVMQGPPSRALRRYDLYAGGVKGSKNASGEEP